jgi:two-component system, response regulator
MTADSATVLLVEDDPDDEELTLRALRRANLNNRVHVAHDGQQAIDYLFGTAEQTASTVPALIVLDLKLPRLGGLEILKRIRAHDRTRRVPVVILTSSSEDEDMINGYDFGANSYVCEPIQFDKFTTAVAQLGVYWLIINELVPPARDDTRADTIHLEPPPSR